MQLDPQDAEARLLLAQAYASSGNQERGAVISVPATKVKASYATNTP